MPCWPRALLGSCLVVTLIAACAASPAPPPKVGDACGPDGELRCIDPSTVLLCRARTAVAIPCRGPNGCQSATSQAPAKCDDDVGVAGEPCTPAKMEGANNYTCSTDRLAQLICAAGKWTILSTCKGPEGCTVRGNLVHCDDDLADVGDPCHMNQGDANYSCTPDRRTLVACRFDRFEQFEVCNGPRGCHIENSLVHCDISSAKEGGGCKSPGDYACSHDSASMLQCTADLVWAKRRDCAPPGCRATATEVICK